MVFSKVTLDGWRAAILSSPALASAMVLRTVATTSLEDTSNCGRLITDLNLAAACWKASRRSGDEFGCAEQVAASVASISAISEKILLFICGCKLRREA